MASTTLVTFLLGHMHGTGSVDLLGSWDNFNKKYPMTKDKQKGHGHWFGTHYIKNIICDGDPSETVRPREGGLKMGGTYWYYYVRDGDTEFHNPTEASTNACPLLPGQTVNVLEIPIEPSLYSIRTSSELSLPLTMDPHDRFKTPRPNFVATTSMEPPKSSGSKSSSKRKRSAALSRSGSASSQRSSKIPALEDFRRQDWFSQSLGRLQTAVVDACLSLYANHEPDIDLQSKELKFWGRRAKTAVNSSMKFEDGQVSYNDSRGGSSGDDLSLNRPRSRFGLDCGFGAARSHQLQGSSDGVIRPVSQAAMNISRNFLDFSLPTDHDLSRPQSWTFGFNHSADTSALLAEIIANQSEELKPATAPAVLCSLENSKSQNFALSTPSSLPQTGTTLNSFLELADLPKPIHTEYNESDDKIHRHSAESYDIQLPLSPASESADLEDGFSHSRNSVLSTSSTFWISSAHGTSSPTTKHVDRTPSVKRRPLPDSPTLSSLHGLSTPPPDNRPGEHENEERTAMLVRLNSKSKRRSLGAGDFFDSQETIKTSAARSDSQRGHRHNRNASGNSDFSNLSRASTLLTSQSGQTKQQDIGDLSYLSAVIT